MANIVISGDSSGSVTLSAPAVSGTTVLTLPTTSGTLVTTAGATALTTSGNLTFTGTGNRILGDFSNATSADRVSIQSSTTNGNTALNLIPNGTSVISSLLAFANSTLTNASFGQLRVEGSVDVRLVSSFLGSGTALPLTMFTGGSERLRIDTSGNVGIATTSLSNGRLNIVAGTSSTGNSLFLSNTDGTYNPYLQVQHNGINGVKLVNTSSFGGTAGNLTISPAANCIFETGSTERMRIDSSGDMYVGTTSLGTVGSTNGAGLYRLGYVAGCATDAAVGFFARRGTDGNVMEFRKSTTGVGSISVTGSATAYNTSSDYRLKENIAPMIGALTKVQQLKPVTYKWKSDGSDGQGFIAHELAEVVPDAVVGEKDAVDEEGNPKYQGIDTSFLVATLTAALQEQQAIITQLQADVAALKGAA
jgi:hypothetical protein